LGRRSAITKTTMAAPNSMAAITSSAVPTAHPSQRPDRADQRCG
jgi:hypothetical protein